MKPYIFHTLHKPNNFIIIIIIIIVIVIIIILIVIIMIIKSFLNVDSIFDQKKINYQYGPQTLNKDNNWFISGHMTIIKKSFFFNFLYRSYSCIFFQICSLNYSPLVSFQMLHSSNIVIVLIVWGLNIIGILILVHFAGTVYYIFKIP